MAHMRIDDELYSKIKYLARQSKMSSSDYVQQLLDASEGGPRVSPAEPPKQQWQKVEPTTAQLREMGTPTYSRLDEIKKEISQIEDDLLSCQDPDEGKRLFGRINNLYAEKDEIILQEAEK